MTCAKMCTHLKVACCKLRFLLSYVPLQGPLVPWCLKLVPVGCFWLGSRATLIHTAVTCWCQSLRVSLHHPPSPLLLFLQFLWIGTPIQSSLVLQVSWHPHTRSCVPDLTLNLLQAHIHIWLIESKILLGTHNPWICVRVVVIVVSLCCALMCAIICYSLFVSWNQTEEMYWDIVRYEAEGSKN